MSRTAIAGCGPASASVRSPPAACCRRSHTRRISHDPERDPLGTPPEGRVRIVRSADGTLLHAEVFGPEDGATVVLAHGWTEALQYWIYVIRALSERGVPRRRLRPARPRQERGRHPGRLRARPLRRGPRGGVDRLRPAGTARDRRRPLARRDVDRRLGRGPRRRAARRGGGAAEHGRGGPDRRAAAVPAPADRAGAQPDGRDSRHPRAARRRSRASRRRSAPR